MNARGSHLWGICPQNKIFTKWCTVESLSANILEFNDQEKSKLTLPSKWNLLCIDDTNNIDEKKQPLTEHLCIQMIIINKKSFLHLYWEQKIKWDLKENKCCRLGSKMEINPQVQALHSDLSPTGLRPWLPQLELSLLLLLIFLSHPGQTEWLHTSTS